jgi:hypothetical protein
MCRLINSCIESRTAASTHIARTQFGQIMDLATKNNERFIVDRRGEPAGSCSQPSPSGAASTSCVSCGATRSGRGAVVGVRVADRAIFEVTPWAQFPLRGRGSVRIATYNVNGINGRLANLLDWLRETSPDIACLQELKAPEEKFPAAAIRMAGYGAVWHGQKAWNGVAILQRASPGAYLVF